MTVRQLCQTYLNACEKGLIIGKGGRPKKASTLYVDRGRIERHIIPLLGARRIRDLRAPDISRFMRDVAAGKTASRVGRAGIGLGQQGRAPARARRRLRRGHQLRPRHHRPTRRHTDLRSMPPRHLGWSVRTSPAFWVASATWRPGGG
jgi:hypothetical protein